MFIIKATCKTNGCKQKGVTHEFQSPTTTTICFVCNKEPDLVITEVTDGNPEETV